jgi:prevent-host-death family protein
MRDSPNRLDVSTYATYALYAVPEVLAASDVRKRWAEVLRRAVAEKHPVVIGRAGLEPALLIGAEELERLLVDYEFHPEVFFEESAVSIWLPELTLYGRGENYDEAHEDLVHEVLDYLDDYLGDAPLYLRAPNRAEQFPYVIKALVADATGRLAEVLFDAPRPVAAA